MITRDSFIASLNNVSTVNEHYAFIDQHAAQGDLEMLTEIFTELANLHPGSRTSEWSSGAVLERIIHSLALTDGFDNAFTALELAAVAHSQGRKGSSVRLRAPAVVSVLVAAQSPGVIDTLLRNLTDLETVALILHEAVVRRKLSEEVSVGREVQERLTNAKHPLSSLPLMLFDLEQGVLLPEYRPGSSGTSIPIDPRRKQSAAALGLMTASLEIAETTCPERANLISAAVMNWKEESNGGIEARAFRAHLSSRDSLAAVLPSLGLECLEAMEEIHFHEDASAEDAFTDLFSAASRGGAYNYGNFAAYGRLLAWRSLAGLVGASADTPIRDIAMSSQNCRWCLFVSPSWHYQVAWDIGIACYNPELQKVAVLAATDTD